MTTKEQQEEKQQIMKRILSVPHMSKKNKSQLLARNEMAATLATLLSTAPIPTTLAQSPRKTAQVQKMIEERVKNGVKRDIVPIALPPLSPKNYKQTDGSYALNAPHSHNHMSPGPPRRVSQPRFASSSNAPQVGCIGRLCDMMFKRSRSRKGGNNKRKMRKIKTRRMKRYNTN